MFEGSNHPSDSTNEVEIYKHKGNDAGNRRVVAILYQEVVAQSTLCQRVFLSGDILGVRGVRS